MVNEDNIVEVIKKLLSSKKIRNQATIAEGTGFDKSTISNILSGRTPPSYKFAKKFEEAFADLIGEAPSGDTESISSLRQRISYLEEINRLQAELLEAYRKLEKKK